MILLSQLVPLCSRYPGLEDLPDALDSHTADGIDSATGQGLFEGTQVVHVHFYVLD